MAIIVVTGSAGSRRDPTASALGNDPALDEEKDSGCDPCDLWMLSPSAASVLYGHLPISSIQVGLNIIENWFDLKESESCEVSVVTGCCTMRSIQYRSLLGCKRYNLGLSGWKSSQPPTLAVDWAVAWESSSLLWILYHLGACWVSGNRSLKDFKSKQTERLSRKRMNQLGTTRQT